MVYESNNLILILKNPRAKPNRQEEQVRHLMEVGGLVRSIDVVAGASEAGGEEPTNHDCAVHGERAVEASTGDHGPGGDLCQGAAA